MQILSNAICIQYIKILRRFKNYLKNKLNTKENKCYKKKAISKCRYNGTAETFNG